MAQMRLYVDEAGNSGGVMNARRSKSTGEDVLNFLEQPLFVNGAVLTRGAEDEVSLLERYRSVKQRFPDFLRDGELKGSDLSARRCNEALHAVVEEVFDSSHFYANVYDKRFYLSTLILIQLCPSLHERKDLFYHLASELSEESDGFFVRYCLLVQEPTEDAISDYLNYLSTYRFQDSIAAIGFPSFLADLINSGDVSLGRTLLGKDAYARPVAANLINLNCLGELVLLVKHREHARNEDLEVMHDKIDGIGEAMRLELRSQGVRVTFEDSSRYELLQLADNVASLLCHCMNRVKNHLSEGLAWKKRGAWDNAVLSCITRSIGYDNIKLTVPLNDIGVYQGISELYKEQRCFGVVDPLPSALELQGALNSYVAQSIHRELVSLGEIDRNVLDELERLRR